MKADPLQIDDRRVSHVLGSEQVAQIKRRGITLNLEGLRARGRDNLHLDLARVGEGVEIGECDAGQGPRFGTIHCVFRVELRMLCACFRMIVVSVIIMGMVVMCVFVFGVVIIVTMIIVGLLFFRVIIVTVVVMGVILMTMVVIRMRIFAFKLCTGLYDRTGRRRGQHKQIRRARQFGQSLGDGCAIFRAVGRVFEANNVSPRRMKFHRHRRAFNRDVQTSNPMFMRIQLARFLRQSRCCDQGKNKGGQAFHRHGSMTV